MRVEQLATEAHVSVDTVRYYQSKGLLDPPRREGRVAWYGPDHLERIGRIRSLQARGFTLATIVRLVNGDLDAADEALVAELSVVPGPEVPSTAPAGDGGRPSPTVPASEPPRDHAMASAGSGAPDGAHPTEELLTLEQLADRTGVPLALLKAVEAEGLLIPRRVGTEERYTRDDVDAAGAGLLLLEWGVPLTDLLDLARRHHAATEFVAREAVDLFSTHVRGSLRRQHGEATSEEAAARLVQAYAELLPAVNTLVGHHFSRTLLRAAFEHIEAEGTDAERQAVWAEAATVVADADADADAGSGTTAGSGTGSA
jgi:DNA-binding transcriptional MerR regulator